MGSLGWGSDPSPSPYRLYEQVSFALCASGSSLAFRAVTWKLSPWEAFYLGRVGIKGWCELRFQEWSGHEQIGKLSYPHNPSPGPPSLVPGETALGSGWGAELVASQHHSRVGEK